MSNGAFTLTGDQAEWKTIEIDGSIGVLDMAPAVLAKINPAPQADFYAFFLPPNYGRDRFAGSAIGLGLENGPYSWMKVRSSFGGLCVFFC